jgi:ATP-dependent protease HslVU (ClpYQ) peptidase subunit
MTCIVGLAHSDGVYIAADSLGSGGGVGQEYNTPKLVKLDVFQKQDLSLTKIFLGIGYTSSYRMGDILRYNFTPPPIEVGEDENEYLVKDFIPELIKCFEEHSFVKSKDGTKSGGSFLIGLRNRLFNVQDDFSVLEPSCGYISVGSGQEFAMGAMYAQPKPIDAPSEAVLLAIKAASEFSTTVGGSAAYIKI